VIAFLTTYGTMLVWAFTALALAAVCFAAVRGEEQRRELVRRAREDCWPTTRLWNPERCAVCLDRAEVQDGACVCETVS
jgi:hypothetical protein